MSWDFKCEWCLARKPMSLNTKRQETTITEPEPASFCPDKVATVHSTTGMDLCDKQMPREHPRLFYTASDVGGWQQFQKQGMHLIFQAHRASSSQQVEYTSKCVFQDLPRHVTVCICHCPHDICTSVLTGLLMWGGPHTDIFIVFSV